MHIVIQGADTMELEAPSLKPSSRQEDQMEASRDVYTTSEGLVRAGVWECTPGQFASDRVDSSEFCHIISGRATLTHIDGQAREINAGDLLVLPRGWRGTWDIHETIRKIYVVSKEQ